MHNFLPAEIIVNILSCLPVESVLQCKLVCKTWRVLICHPSFVHMHLLQQLDDQNAAAGKVGFLFLNLEKLYYGEYDDDQSKSSMTLTRSKIKPPSSMGWIVGSSNGLICFSVYQRFGDPIYICNPITREYVNLPKFNINMIEEKPSSDFHRVSAGFGYHSFTNEYKVVRIVYSFFGESLSIVGCVQVYTLGSGSGWRNIGETTYVLGCDNWYYSIGALAHGALHWMDKKGRIVAFDLAEESFQLLPSPPCFPPGDFPFGEYKTFRLGVFGGWLSVSYDDWEGKAEVWSFKKKENSSNYDMKEKDYYQFWSWSMELSIEVEFMDDFDYDLPNVLLTKNCEVLFCNRTRLYRYDTKTANIEDLVDFNADSVYQVVPDHMNTFVSLKALEEDTEIIEAD